jgi:hypothetical protein
MNFDSSEKTTWSHFWASHLICESANLRRAAACFGVIRAILQRHRPWKPIPVSVQQTVDAPMSGNSCLCRSAASRATPDRIFLAARQSGAGIRPWPSDGLLWSVSGTSRGSREICGSFGPPLTCCNQVWHQFPQMAYWWFHGG